MKKTILSIFGVVCVVTSIVFFALNIFRPLKKYEVYVEKYSAEYSLEPSLVYAIIRAESGFDAGAISKAGACGLMQLLPSTAEWIASKLKEEFFEENLFDAETNIRYGCYYLKYLSDKFENFDAIVCAYNAGETAVRSWLDENGNLLQENIKFSETKNYLKKVKNYYNYYKMS